MQKTHIIAKAVQYFDLNVLPFNYEVELIIDQNVFSLTFANVRRLYFKLESIERVDHGKGCVLTYQHVKDGYSSSKITITPEDAYDIIWIIKIDDNKNPLYLQVIFSEEQIRMLRPNLQTIYKKMYL